MAREIQLKNTKEITLVVRDEEKIIIDSVRLDSVTDDGNKVYCQISFIGTQYSKVIILWEGESYTNIGQWTDEDVNARILELI